MQEDFVLRAARPADVAGMMQVMDEAVATMQKAEWFIPDTREYVEARLDSPLGFALVAQAAAGEIVAYFTVKLAGNEPDALGRYLGMDEAQLLRTAQMDSCCVRPDSRGHGLEGSLLKMAEQRLATMPYDTLLGTVHPDNVASRHTAEKCGYTVAKRLESYHGLPRLLMYKTNGKSDR